MDDVGLIILFEGYILHVIWTTVFQVLLVWTTVFQVFSQFGGAIKLIFIIFIQMFSQLLIEIIWIVWLNAFK